MGGVVRTNEERIADRREELSVIARSNEELDERARQAANVFFATRSYAKVAEALGLKLVSPRQAIVSMLSRPAALKELDVLRERLRKSSMISREDAVLFLMRCLELEPSNYMSERTEVDCAGQLYKVQYVDFGKLAEAKTSKFIDRVDWDAAGRAKGSFISKMDAFKRLCDLMGWDAPKKVEFDARIVDPRIMSEEQLLKLRDAAVKEAAMTLVQPLLVQPEEGAEQDGDRGHEVAGDKKDASVGGDEVCLGV